MSLKRSCFKILLSAVLHHEVFPHQIDYAPTELYSEPADAKDIRFDLSLTLDNASIINIEMQMVSSLKEICDRATYYACLCYSGQKESKGKPYHEFRPVFQIFFLNQTVFPNRKNYFSRYAFLELEDHERLSDKVEIGLIEIPKAIGQKEDRSLLSQWCYFLKHGHEKEDEIVKKLVVGYDSFRKAEEVMEKISYDERLRDRAFAREKRLKDEAQIRYEGRKEAKLEIAKQMLSANLPLDQIIQFTGLAPQELDQL